MIKRKSNKMSDDISKGRFETVERRNNPWVELQRLFELRLPIK